MWPAHVSFPIGRNLTDTQGDGGSLALLLIQLRAMGNGAAEPCFGSATVSAIAAAVEEVGNVLLQKCLKTMANRGLKEKVKQQDQYYYALFCHESYASYVVIKSSTSEQNADVYFDSFRIFTVSSTDELYRWLKPTNYPRCRGSPAGLP